MSYSESQPTVSLIAETTFASSDIGKFMELSSAAGRVVVVGSTDDIRLIGTLQSETYSTSTGANEAVTIGLLSGIGPVYMAGSTLHLGMAVACSTEGFGTAPTTTFRAIGYIVDGTSGTTGRLCSVLFAPPGTLKYTT